MSFNNNINTGLAEKVDAFRWSGSMDNKPHVIGVKTSAPDFTITPTPASSYQNIHIMLDHVHPSSVTTRTEVLSEPLQMRSATSFSSQGSANRSFSTLPNAMDNKLDNVPRSSTRLVPDRIDPEQPMARSDAALTSLKSEIAPMTAPVVPLEYDDLAERTDRALPASVNLSLFDETEAALASKSLTKQWALQEEEERSWRMSRDVDEKWRSNWGLVSKQLTGRKFYTSNLEESERLWRMNRFVDQSWKSNWGLVSKELLGRKGSFNLTGLEEKERSWRMSRSLDQSWKSNWGLVSKQLLGQKGSNLNTLEERERQWRMKRAINNEWLTQWKQVGEEIKVSDLELALAYDDLSDWASKLNESIEKEVDRIIQNVNALGPNMELMERNLRKYSWDQIERMESEERLWRSSRSVDPVFYGNWHRVAEELKSVVGTSWSEWFDNLKMKTSKRAYKAVNKIENFELPAISLPSLPTVNLSGMSMPSMPSIHLPKVNLPDLKLGVVKSEATTPMYTDGDLVDFTFRSRRCPREIIELEEAERFYRINKGADPVVYGLWFRAGQELKYKYSLRPTFSGLGESLAASATTLADRAIDTLGSLYESGQRAFEKAEESILPARPSEFAGHKHLNFYAFTAEKVDFTFKSRRTPAYILRLEEAERAERVKRYNANKAGYKRWNKFLLDNIPQSNIEKAEGAFFSAVHKAEDGISGFFGSIASVLHLQKKQESAATADKVDPITAARKGRVNDELLHLTVKSV